MANELAKTANELAKTEERMAVLEKVVVEGDLSRLSPAERVIYYRNVCESLGLNPLTRPFDYIVLNGRLTLYARKDATDQLRRIHGVSVRIVSREFVENLGLYVVVARATTADGREDEAIGAVNVRGLSGDALANAIMKAETKAKRRVTLSIVGLGWTDESEVDTIPGAQTVRVDPETGEILDAPARPAPAQPALEEKEVTAKQLKLLAVLMRQVGLGREEAHRYVSALLGREIGSAKELSKDEASRVIDHFQELSSWFDAMEVPEDLRREVMADAARHGDVFDSQETLQAVVEGYKAM